MRTSRLRERPLEPDAVALIEEAVHLLRLAPIETFFIYFLGAAPWVLGFLFFWAHTTWFAPSHVQIAWAALGLVTLFTVLKVAQAEFCLRLMAQRLGASAEPLSIPRLLRLAGRQLSIQSWGIVVLPIAALLTVPFGWVYAFYQSAVVCDGGSKTPPRLWEKSWSLASRWPGGNHLGLLFLSVLAAAVWLNLMGALYVVPMFVSRMLGIDNIFGMTGWTVLNSTFLACTFSLTWFAMDPLIKAFYVLRVFYGEAQSTGEDLRLELKQSARSRSKISSAVICLCCLLGVGWAQTSLLAGDIIPQAAIDPASLDAAIDHVLAKKEFAWRLRPTNVPDEARDQTEGPIDRFVKEGVKMLRKAWTAVSDAWQSLQDWWRHVFGTDESRSKPISESSITILLTRMLIYAFLASALGLLGWLIVLVVRRSRIEKIPTQLQRATTIAAPDLRDEHIEAAQMPVDGWVALAREQIEKQEWRLALRALYLASLVRLSHHGLVSLARFKTNLDYERELRRRASGQDGVVEKFSQRRHHFDSVWYGRTPVGESSVRAWLAELESAREG